MSINCDLVASFLKRAARTLLSSPLRRGNVVHLGGTGNVMITGDLHGDVSSFDRIVDRADLRGNPQRHLVLQELVHGRDDNGECGSCVLIEKVANLVVEFAGRVHVLMGNHEMAELTGRMILKDSTALNRLLNNSAAARYGDRADEMLAYFAGFWRSMLLAVRTANRVFISHSTPMGARLDSFDAGVLDRALTEDDFTSDGSAYALLWGRDYAATTAERLSAVLDADFFVVGHTPCAEGFETPNQRHIIIDSQSPRGVYMLLPLCEALTLPEIIGRIRPLWP